MPNGWPWAHYGGNLFYNAANAFIYIYFPYVWTKPDQIWRDGLGPRWNLPPEDLELHGPGLLNNKATQLTVELPGLRTPVYGHQDKDYRQSNTYFKT